MQNNNKKLEEKLVKTSIIIGLGNLIVSPVYLIDSKLGLAFTIAVNAFLIQQLHNIGKSRRPGSNALNSINTFFSSKAAAESSEIENAFRNIINGGDAVYNEVSNFMRKSQ
ncbi:Uncharacterised protein [Legionella beliardensis]|uniref:Uncharacterized protein n=1 Tax=Legionella beliardensis TaxID=91822 RepID=A0A378HYU9_9GAMM|nr:hypothetical protein [Legionella beliardensis]STX27893.1 Uncharacterised protein [Legionella beliardensis]